MITTEDHFAVEPWSVTESSFNPDRMGQVESVFALSNGHVGMRGGLEEGEPEELPGTYLNGFYEERPLPYAEAGYGYPESGQTIVNVTDGRLIRLLVDDSPFDLRYGTVESHHRTLDLRTGILDRETVWRAPTGVRVRVRTSRIVSFTQRAIAAIRYEVEPLDGPVRVVVQSELMANEPMPTLSSDPRAAAVMASPLKGDTHWGKGMRAVLAHHTKQSGLRLAVGMDHLADVPGSPHFETASQEDLARLTIAAELAPGQPLRLTKLLAYGWSSRRSDAALADQVEAALAEALHTGWKGLAEAQKEFLDGFWERADVEVDGDAEVQQALRFALFHTLQAGARGQARAIPAKGLTGPGYDGHAFWDTETYVLPVLTYTLPESARDALIWRHTTLDAARERAKVLGQKGAAFPWRTISGVECSAYWPAGTAAFHINADIADAVRRYYQATEDDQFEHDYGLELLVETARLWISLGHHDVKGAFRIHGVTGPDEYTAVIDNNVYTNLMAARNMRTAAEAAERHPQRASELGVDAEEAAGWRDAADKMVIPYDDDLQVHQQCEGFTRNAPWDFDGTPAEGYPLLLHYPYFDLYRKQVVKQADLVMAMHLCGDLFTAEEKARNFAYYEAVTVRDSSLSACTQAVLAAEVGHVELAYDYLGEAALMDLDDLNHNTGDGVHIASLAGAWIATVQGLGGMRDHGGQMQFSPRLPEAIGRLAFRLGGRGRRLRVEVTKYEAVYELLEGEAVTLTHHGKEFEVTPAKKVRRKIPPAPQVAPVKHPAGREPSRRRPTLKGQGG